MLLALDWKQVAAFTAVNFVALICLGVLVYLGFGLFRTRSLFRRELSAYFLSGIAYVVMVAFLGVISYRFYLTMEKLTAEGPAGVEYPMQYLFSSGLGFWLIYLLVPPLLTMRLFAEERGSGTLEMLMTAPVRDWQVVLSKFLACLAFYVVMWLPTVVFLPILLDLKHPEFHAVWTVWSILLVAGLAGIVVALLSALMPFGSTGRAVALLLLVAGLACMGAGAYGHYSPPKEEPKTEASAATPPAEPAKHLVDIEAGIDPMPVVTSYVGVVLAGAMFLSLGLLVSSLVKSQMVSALVSMVLSLLFVAVGFWEAGGIDTDNPLWPAIFYTSVPLHFDRDFGRGIIDTRHVALYLTVTVACLFLTVRSLESRRWR